MHVHVLRNRATAYEMTALDGESLPERIHDELGLSPRDYLEVELERGKVVMTPRTLVDRQIEKRIAEGLEDFRAGRTHGPFDSGRQAVRFLQAEAKRRSRAIDDDGPRARALER
jgi:hypothetical protein